MEGGCVSWEVGEDERNGDLVDQLEKMKWKSSQ